MRKYKPFLSDFKSIYLSFLNSDLFDALEAFEAQNNSVKLVEIDEDHLVFDVEPKKSTKELAQRLAKDYHGYNFYYCNGQLYLTTEEDQYLLDSGYKLASRYGSTKAS